MIVYRPLRLCHPCVCAGEALKVGDGEEERRAGGKGVQSWPWTSKSICRESRVGAVCRPEGFFSLSLSLRPSFSCSSADFSQDLCDHGTAIVLSHSMVFDRCCPELRSSSFGRWRPRSTSRAPTCAFRIGSNLHAVGRSPAWGRSGLVDPVRWVTPSFASRLHTCFRIERAEVPSLLNPRFISALLRLLAPRATHAHTPRSHDSAMQSRYEPVSDRSDPAEHLAPTRNRFRVLLARTSNSTDWALNFQTSSRLRRGWLAQSILIHSQKSNQGRDCRNNRMYDAKSSPRARRWRCNILLVVEALSVRERIRRGQLMMLLCQSSSRNEEREVREEWKKRETAGLTFARGGASDTGSRRPLYPPRVCRDVQRVNAQIQFLAWQASLSRPDVPERRGSSGSC